MIVRTPFSVLPDTVTPPSPTNFTSSAFFTWSVYAFVNSPVVLSEDTTQPILRKSPTVAAVVSGTVGFPVAGLLKSTRPAFGVPSA